MPLSGALGDRLSDDVLARCARLPLKPAAVTLANERVVLVPLDLERDVGPLYAVSSGRAVEVGARAIPAYDPDDCIWRYMFAGPFADAAALSAFLGATMAAPDALPFTVTDAVTGAAIGVACYVANAPEHLKIELGSIWYSPVVQGTGVSPAATYLLLEHAFALGYRRLEWKCDALNERSRRAALRMGFQFEGIQEAHYIVKGRNRDTAWFRMLHDEWPDVAPRLRALFE
jgi:RimJ/RimL family protein N-acetyltransferase